MTSKIKRRDTLRVEGRPPRPRPAEPYVREREIEKYFCDRVKYSGGMVRKVQFIGHRGAPDRWCGWWETKRTGWVELKKPSTPNAEAHQEREHAKLRACGERVDVLATIEAIDAYIEEMTRG